MAAPCNARERRRTAQAILMEGEPDQSLSASLSEDRRPPLNPGS
jgi:hypothetical protein